MTIEQFLNLLACAALILFGVYALLRPHDAAEIAHLKPHDPVSVAEIRISFGGLSLMTGLAPLLLNNPVAYQTVGIIYLGAFVIRLVTVFIDHPQIERPFIITGIFELLIGLILFLR